MIVLCRPHLASSAVDPHNRCICGYTTATGKCAHVSDRGHEP